MDGTGCTDRVARTCPDGLVDAAPPSLADLIGEGYLAQVEDIAPIQLVGREDELDALTQFCAGDAAYQWWQAGPWFGKTALSSWLCCIHPQGVRVVSFFITGRLAGQSDHTAYTRAVVEQLAAFVGDTTCAERRSIRLGRTTHSVVEKGRAAGRTPRGSGSCS